MTTPEEGATNETISGHFRVWKDVYDSLEDEARERKVSMNTLVNQVLSTHTRDEELWEKKGTVRMTKDAYRLHLILLSEDNLRELGKMLAKTGPRPVMLARKGSVSLEAIMDYLRMLSRFGWWSLHEARRNGKRAVSLMHDFGPKESVLLAAYIADVFALVDIRGNVTTTDSSVMIEY